ncbi:(2Fe-2S) ferredoxin domain-containing protein [Streptomyces sp. NBC_01754]|uniref:(2Fe-2S) ferredoxin domain-containing protein n=1 Tax=Streptomyces sp. NBC_01754 TaxID=2975930 RepID=UPI002DDA6613|nr:(2Fe-2S) ferredoxin domain-containing protein [Streptomyces sp. NBC_01754]WSC95893.1 (2Fe-2S) ferredoxin domain-containing protein [Streptomyces sp. NBC_01754]
MSRRTRPASAPGPSRPTVSVCRGCCCGTPKIPGVDHAGQLAQLRGSLDGSATVRAVECLDACEHGNVIVVQPSAEGRRAGGRPVWLGLVNDPDALTDITAWARDGGPGLADPPEILELYVFTPSRRVREGLEGSGKS